MSATQPAVFLSHGAGPCFFMEPEGRFREIARGSPTAQWLQSLSSYCPERPKAVLVISAHWEEQEEFAVTGSDTPGLLFDYFNFPAHTYQLKYPSPGAPDTAQQVKRLVEEATGRRVGVDTRRGLDHGVFVPLLLGFPEADVPVLQLSLCAQGDGSFDPDLHQRVGRALALLRRQGVLLVGSGQATHNAGRTQDGAGTAVAPWASAFLAWLDDTLTRGPGDEADCAQRLQLLRDAPQRAPHYWEAHPRDEHFVPLQVVAAAAGGAPATKEHGAWAMGTLSLASYVFAAQ